MSEDVYRRLAQRLDAIPNGFPPTVSGVERRLLAKMFTPEEAALAAIMRLAREPAADIAARAGVDVDAANRTLKAMARKGLIVAERGDGSLAFRLMPFVVGIYEAQLPYLDAEMAMLFEQYYQEARGAFTRDTPALHRVIPVEQAVPLELEIFPHERATELLMGAKSWGVRHCICRVQQRLISKGCDRPVENCLVFAPVEGAFDHSEVERAITREEALRILREAEEAGLVHSTGNFQGPHFYICNCCTCCCGILRSVAEFDIPTAIARSDFHAVVADDICAACADCVARCQFGALTVSDAQAVCVVDHTRCVGCGQCVTACSTGALHMERRPAGEVSPPPVDRQAWMQQRARERKLDLADIL